MRRRGDRMLIVLFVVILYVYLIAPRMFHKPDCSVLVGTNFAHRGIHNKKCGRPENSLSAIQMAVDLHYGIEIDVQLTKDNKVVVFHDFDLKRVCGIDKKVCDLTYEELTKYHLLDTKEQIPLLSQVLEIVDGSVPLLVEFKCKNIKDQIAPRADDLLAEYKGVYYIQSFHPIVLWWYRKNKPNIIRGQLAEHHGWKNLLYNFVLFLHKHLIFNAVSRPDYISYNFEHQKEVSLNICKYFFRRPIAAWTVRSKKELQKCMDKFDVIIFEDFYI